MFRSISIAPNCNDYERSRTPSPCPGPIMRSDSVGQHSVLPSFTKRCISNICESPEPIIECEVIGQAQQTQAQQDQAQASKQKFMAPPMRYDLHNSDAAYAYDHIKILTANDTEATKYLEKIKPEMFKFPSKPVVFGYIPAPPIDEITKRVIGGNGHFFKLTTATTGVYFIWHDIGANMFLFWGPSTFKVVKALNSIRWRIFKQCELYNSIKEIYSKDNDEDESDDDDYDMPRLISCGNSPDCEHPDIY
jgi:hypothetical protein